MKFGINYISSAPTTYEGKAAAHDRALNEWLNLGIEAERLGFWSAWTTEHHFQSDRDYQPYGVSADEYAVADYDMATDPLQLLGWLAAKTTNLRVGSGVVVLHWDHPMRVAERAAILDNLSGGRLELGVGRGAGWREHEMYKVPVDPAENGRKYHESIEIIRRAWAGEPFEFQGEFFEFPKVALTPTPKRQPAPLWIGSASLDSAEWAGGEGLPYATITWPLTQIEHYIEKRRVFTQAASHAGYDPAAFDVPHFLMMYCGETDEEAAETARYHLMQFQYIVEGHYEFWRRSQKGTWLGASAGEMENLDYLANFPIIHHIIGSPDTCAERVDFFKKDVGVDYIVCNIGFGAMPYTKTLESMRRFADKVIPRFA